MSGTFIGICKVGHMAMTDNKTDRCRCGKFMTFKTIVMEIEAVCDDGRCTGAAGDECICQCQGVFHGTDHLIAV